MRIVYWGICLWISPLLVSAQDLGRKLQAAVKQLEADTQMRHAIYSLFVIEAKTGKVVFDKHSEIGLVPASCQKLFTSGAAFELLGGNYKYKTELFSLGKIKDGVLQGDILVVGYGDPSLGSWRFKSEQENNVFDECIKRLRSKKVNLIDGHVLIDDSRFSAMVKPGGWIWDDIGNYYGAGAGAVNWRENQFDLTLRSGSVIGSQVEIVEITPTDYIWSFNNEVKAAAKGSGDNAYIYPPSNGMSWLVKGTIPIGEKNFVISGATQDPSEFFMREFDRKLDSSRILYKKPDMKKVDGSSWRDKDTSNKTLILQHFSPPFDSLNYWFLRRSINLYGEAFIKTIALEKTGLGSTEKGVELVKKFWSEKGIDQAAINIIDGSGLSPQNRVTTNALVRVLQYAKTRPWYNSFYTSLPTYNGMKMKSGSIGGARSFAGYHTSKDGKEYIFAIIVNNYDGSSSAMVRKMYQVLDNLK